MAIAASNHSVLIPTDAENISLCVFAVSSYGLILVFNVIDSSRRPMEFTPGAASSRLYSRLGFDLMMMYQHQPVTMNAHIWGVDPKPSA